MRLFTDETSHADTIAMAQALDGSYDKPEVFHCYWNTVNDYVGLNELHLFSILSCYYFNVHNNKHKIILWLENTELNEYAEQIKQYAEIRQFDMAEQTKGTFLEDFAFEYPERSGKLGSHKIRRHSDCARLVLLYKYGGCWFDLDCLFLRCFDPLFAAFPDELCFYRIQSGIANNAVILSPQPKSSQTEKFLQFLAERNGSWGFAEGGLNLNIKADALVLPCSWFNPCISNGGHGGMSENFFRNTPKEWNFDNFYKGAFCHHWHHSFHMEVGETSIMGQLVNIIKSDIGV